MVALDHHTGDRIAEAIHGDGQGPQPGALLLRPTKLVALEDTQAAAGFEVNRAEVVFVRPRGVAADWEQTSLWAAAAAIPGVRVRCDEEGKLAQRFGVQTSGHVLLYDPEGHLLFSGGITRSRGQQGDSAGRRALLARLSGETRSLTTTAVFGCPLFAPGELCEKEDNVCQP